MNFGERLKKLRTEKKLSQEQLANRLNVSRSAVAKWETGKGIPDIDNLIAISEEFGLSLDYKLKKDISIKHEVEKDRKKKRNKFLMCGIINCLTALLWFLIANFNFQCEKHALGFIDIGIGLIWCGLSGMYLYNYCEAKKENET